MDNVLGSFFFYARPVLAIGYCRCLRLCVCVRVCVSMCVTKFGPKMQKTLVKIPIVLGGN